jgi:hypothetical protein
MAKRPPETELVALYTGIIAQQGYTTSPGAGGGTSIIDAGLIGFGANSFIGMALEIYPGLPAQVDSQVITAFNNSTGEVTVSSAFKGGQVPKGVAYQILGLVKGSGGYPWVAETTGTMSFNLASAAEQTLVTIAVPTRVKVDSIWIDMANVTRNTTINVYEKIDGVNFRLFAQHFWTAGVDTPGVMLGAFMPRSDFQVTLTCDGFGAGAVNVPYAVE